MNDCTHKHTHTLLEFQNNLVYPAKWLLAKISISVSFSQ